MQISNPTDPSDPTDPTAVPAAVSDESAPSAGTLARAAVRPLLTVVALLAAYYLLPVDRELTGWTLVLLVGGLCLIVVLVGWQFRQIMRSSHPVLRGVNALALIIPLYLVIFADVCFVVAENDPTSFTEPLTRTDALYFVMTVFATVGFGDISPVTSAARLLVTGQMVGNLLLIGVALRVILTAVHLARQRQTGHLIR